MIELNKIYCMIIEKLLSQTIYDTSKQDTLFSTIKEALP